MFGRPSFVIRQSYRQLYHYQLKRGSLSWKPSYSLTSAPLNGAWTWQGHNDPYQPQPGLQNVKPSSNKISDPILPQRKTLWSRIPGPSWAPQPSHTKKSETFDKKVQLAVGEKALDDKEMVQDKECPDLLLLLKAITHMLEWEEHSTPNWFTVIREVLHMLVNINVENKCCTTDFDHLISDTLRKPNLILKPNQLNEK